MKLLLRGRVFLEICGDDTVKGVVTNLLYGLKHGLMDIRRPDLWLSFNGVKRNDA